MRHLQAFTALLVVILTASPSLSDESESIPIDITAIQEKADTADAQVQYELGKLYYLGEVVDQNYTEAARWFHTAAKQDHEQAHIVLANMYIHGEGVERNMQKALKLATRAVKSDSADAQYTMGVIHENLGDFAEAMKWYKQAAASGDSVAELRLGAMYDAGRGVPQDHAEAVKWYRKSAEQGLAAAQHNLGVSYAKGKGVPHNDAEAFQWFLLAAKQGYAPAQTQVGTRYSQGAGVPQDYAAALEWLRKAAELGDTQGQAVLAQHYLVGWGVPIDYIHAYAWANVARADSEDINQILNAGITETLDKLTARMTAEQIAESQELSRSIWERLQEHETEKWMEPEDHIPPESLD